MKELQFIERRRADWQAWDQWLDKAARRGADKNAVIAVDDISCRFRRLCNDLSLARDRQYSAPLVDQLHHRVLAVHQRIYSAATPRTGSVLAFIAAGLPILVRREWRLVLLSGALLFLPLALMIAVTQIAPDAVYLVLTPEQVGNFQEMYAPDAKHLGRPRTASSEWQMWGHYIANNVQIDFQCFGGGLVFGIGAVFYLLFNGLVLGAVAGHLTQLGYITTFWGFVAGHSAFELTGAVLAGAAGLKLSQALLAPGNRSRLSALKTSAGEAVGLLYGAASLTFLAAFIEAFWSPSRDMPFSFKVGAGLALWVVTWAYLLLAGRGRRAT